MGGPGSGGGNRKPARLKVLQGTARPDREGHDEPRPRPVVPSMPRGLDARARRLWHDLAPRLEPLGLLRETDAPMFVALCESWARYREACQRLRETIQAVRGQKPSSAEGLHWIRKVEISVSSAEQSFTRLAREFGLSPASRSRLDVPDPERSEDDFEEYLARGLARGSGGRR